MTEKGALLNNEGELTAPAFEKMLLAQIASFTRRKVVSAMQRIDNDVEGELMFALKMLMGTVDQLVTRDETPPKNRKEILHRLFNRTVRTAFHVWKEACRVDDQGGKQAAAGEGTSSEVVLKQIEKAHEMQVGMHEACLAEIRTVGEQVGRLLGERPRLRGKEGGEDRGHAAARTLCGLEHAHKFVNSGFLSLASHRL